MISIPWGQTLSYGEIAHIAGGAPRAVGQACGANMLPLVVPCHRVLAANGIGGYSGGRAWIPSVSCWRWKKRSRRANVAKGGRTFGPLSKTSMRTREQDNARYHDQRARRRFLRLSFHAGRRVPVRALLVIQEIFGVNQSMRQMCDEFAAQGFVALCPDIFWRQEPGIQITDKTDEEWQRAFELFQGFDVDKGIEDLKDSLAALRGLDACTARPARSATAWAASWPS